MSKTTWKQKFLLTAASCLVVLFLLELLLRLGGLLFFGLQEIRNHKFYGNKNVYTIMCIGESTTATGGIHSYPSILENILNQEGQTRVVRVVNAGTPSVQSGYILDHLEADINHNHPDMVLSMVGINDEIYGHMENYKKLSSPKWYHFYHYLKVYKLYTYLKDSLVNYLNKAKLRYILKGDAGPAVIPAVPAGFDDISRFNFSNELVTAAFGPRRELNYKEAFSLLRLAIDVCPTNVNPYMEYINALDEINDHQAAKGIYELAIKNNPKSEWGYAGLSNYYRCNHQAALADEYQAKAVACRKMYLNTQLVQNYRKIKEIVEAHHIKLVCVQYAMREVGPLKMMFPDAKNMVFVDNEKVFKEAVSKFGYDAIFGDTAAGDFGHCTPKGNEILAKNIKSVISPLMK